ncbi:pnk1 [Candida theae]|uniref:Pnk1 n=1 Tax=Candida theae TaxID=1198502 RepID=A0AAD5BB13_9ASCO|nr:pnk1 [Candida theae]KAI5949985.1 pnk1 [Candida theae]
MGYDVISMIRKPSHVDSSDKLSSTLTSAKVIAEKVENDLKSTKFESGWETIGTHLIRNVSTPQVTGDKVKVAAFDLDGTLITTKSGLKFGKGPTDWKWWGNSSTKVPEAIAKLYETGYLIVIFTNQGSVVVNHGSKSYTNLKAKLSLVYKEFVKFEIKSIYMYASPKKPSKGHTSSDEKHKSTRKPEIGMWQDLEAVLTEQGKIIDYEASFFVGDAAGRRNDFSNSDLKFAQNAKIDFKTPEEFFEE